MLEGGRMDVLGAIDELEARVSEAPPVPFSDHVRIERSELFEILDHLRASLPIEAKDAVRIVKQREELLAETRRQCERLLESGRARAARECSPRAVEHLAEGRASALVTEARRAGRALRHEVDEWLDEILETLEANLDRFLDAAHRGRHRMHERSSQESVVSVKAA